MGERLAARRGRTTVAERGRRLMRRATHADFAANWSPARDADDLADDDDEPP